ncbi:MAG TPA: hypothetical protein VG709_01485 [Actinomycetota bacterium]|nr:hypothetical protein [Actinomycetota bacterium]
MSDARPDEDYQDAFARIERRVEAGDADLSELGFWRLVRKVKVEPALAAHWADDCGRIDRMAFERRVRPRFPVWLGNALLLVGSIVLVALVPAALAIARGEWLFERPNPLVAGILAVVAAGGLSVTTHDLAHWVVGRLAGIRFIAYFLDGPTRIQPGLKTDYETYLKASPGSRAAMHAAGAIASKIAPFAVFVAVYLPHRASGYGLLPAWSVWTILAIGVVQLLTDILWSTKTSDWKKVRREARLGRAQRHRR